jgi:hypothetical protein
VHDAPISDYITFKAQTGLIPFVDGTKVRMMRPVPNQVAPLWAMMFFNNVLIALILMGGSICLTLFLLPWQVTAALAHNITALMFGAIVMIIFHKAILDCTNLPPGALAS